MCGITGILSITGMEGKRELNETVRRMTQLMVRRGPDDEGFWGDDQCAFGFRRLSILDLSCAGHQPMFTPDGRYVIIFNGEIYNFRELRSILECQGVVLTSTGDTEVVLNALARWGKAALPKFNGMFALAFYDTREKTLLLARDHAGIKPLYYLHGNRGIIFGSQYNQILVHPWSRERSVDAGVLSLYLQFGHIPAPFGLLHGSSMLKAGCWLEVSSNGDLRQGSYFEFPSYTEPDLRGTEAFEAVDAAVTQAVRRQLVSDVPVGTFLSGGIDSPLITAIVAELQNGSAQAFTIGLNGGDGDESTDATAYAHAFGVEHHVRQFTPADALAMVDDVVASCSEPFADYSIFPTMLVSRLARERVKVMLSGDGGDELFWGYYGRFADILNSTSDFRMPRWLRVVRRVMSRYLGRGEVPRSTMFPSIGFWFQLKHTRIFFDHIRQMFKDLPERTDGFGLFDYAGSNTNRTAQWLRWNEFVGHLNMVLLKVDRGEHASLVGSTGATA
jgi:asparagine synthase (glutamine-hydrolysing)